MAAFIFTCPATLMKVQHWFSDDDPMTDEKQYEAVTCPACTKLHFIHADLLAATATPRNEYPRQSSARHRPAFSVHPTRDRRRLFVVIVCGLNPLSRRSGHERRMPMLIVPIWEISFSQ
jgi:hypothetical protein